MQGYANVDFSKQTHTKKEPLVYLNQKVTEVSVLPGPPRQTLSNISRTGRGAH